jgi:predicted anti-sigma-YlaC factor YlaD
MNERSGALLRLKCRDVSRLLSDGQDQTLPPADRARLRLHLVMCRACRTVNEQFDFLRRAMQQLDHDRPAEGTRL